MNQTVVGGSFSSSGLPDVDVGHGAADDYALDLGRAFEDSEVVGRGRASRVTWPGQSRSASIGLYPQRPSVG